jgi:hypothetical protein
MSGTVPDPTAMDAKLDRILGQLTTINNCLNFNDTRLTRVESGKADASKGAGGDADHGAHGGDDNIHGSDDADDSHDSEWNRA